jgi:hypothetical protein
VAFHAAAGLSHRQSQETCNEVAGRSFRMTWDRRSPWGYGWSVDELEEFPRMPTTRNVVALRQMVAFGRAAWFAANTNVNVETMAGVLSRATGLPPEVAFFFAEAMEVREVVPWTDLPIEGLRLT